MTAAAAPDGAFRITVDFSTTCLTCEEPIEPGERAWWVPKVGCWHRDCDPPRNLAAYRKEQQRSANG